MANESVPHSKSEAKRLAVLNDKTTSIERPARYIVLTHGDDGWQVDAEMDDYAEAVRMTKHYWDHDEHRLARVIDLFPDDVEA